MHQDERNTGKETASKKENMGFGDHFRVFGVLHHERGSVVQLAGESEESRSSSDVVSLVEQNVGLFIPW